MDRQNRRQALHAIRRRVAADAEVHNPIPVSGGIEQPLQIVGKALSRLHPESGGQAVAERRDHGARILSLDSLDWDFLLFFLDLLLDVAGDWLFSRLIAAGAQRNG